MSEPRKPPDASLRFIVHNPHVVKETTERVNVPAFEDVRDFVTAAGGRDLALANHVNAGLALATFFGVVLLQHPIARYDPTPWQTHLAWLQILKSLYGDTLRAALERIRTEGMVLAPVTQQPQPVQPEQQSVRQLFGRLFGGGAP